MDEFHKINLRVDVSYHAKFTFLELKITSFSSLCPVVHTSWLACLLEETQCSIRSQLAAGQATIAALQGDSTFAVVDHAVAELFFVTKRLTSSQASTTFVRLLWTSLFEYAIAQFRTSRYAYHDVKVCFEGLCSKYATLLSKEFVGSAGNPYGNERPRLEAVLVTSLHLRDVAEQIAAARCKNAQDFSWVRRCRLYANTVPDVAPTTDGSGGLRRESTDALPPIAPDTPPLGGGGSVGGVGSDGGGGIRIAMADCTILYGYEYWGSHAPLVLTPTSEKHFLLLMTVVHPGSAHHGSLLGCPDVGGEGTLRRNTVTAFAQLAGRYLVSYTCADVVDAAVVGRIASGLQRVRAWGCFHNVEHFGSALLGALAGSLHMVGCAAARFNVSMKRVLQFIWVTTFPRPDVELLIR